jgi:hypothetical protein
VVLVPRWCETHNGDSAAVNRETPPLKTGYRVPRRVGLCPWRIGARHCRGSGAPHFTRSETRPEDGIRYSERLNYDQGSGNFIAG